MSFDTEFGEYLIRHCCFRVATMRDFAGRSLDDLHGGMEGVLRSDVIKELMAVDVSELFAQWIVNGGDDD